MTQYNFNRRYRLSITRTTEVDNPVKDQVDSGQPIQSSAIGYKSSDDYRIVSESTVDITDLQFTAEIGSDNKTSGTKGVAATIVIYNLSPQTKNVIANTNNVVSLSAGYETEEGELPLLYLGQVKSHYTEKKGEDRLTTLVCGEAHSAKQSIRVTQRLRRGSTYGDVIRDLASIWNAYGVATGELLTSKAATLAPVIDKSPDETFLAKGWVFSGTIYEAMDKVTKQFNYNWQIINNQLFVFPKYLPEMVGVVELSSNQIISYDKAQDGASLPSSSGEDNTVKIKTLLDGRITPRHKLRVRGTDEFNGDYSIASVKHDLDYEGGNWYTTIECKGV